jgi:hypothetical protein
MRPTRLVLWIALAGCDSPSISVDTIDQLYQQVASVLCQEEAQCGAIAQSEVAACTQAALDELMKQQTYDYHEAIADHRLAYNAAQANACLSAFRAVSCSHGFLDLVAGQSCNQIFTPQVPLGGVCRNKVECINSTCSASSGCMGTCVAFVATGGDCSMGGSSCAPSDFCNYSGTTATCTARGGTGASCMNSLQCQPGLVCPVASGAASGSCSEPGGAGANCRSSSDCANGLYCTGDFTTGGTCQAQLAAGASCSNAGSCGDGYTCAGASAMQAGSCKAWLEIGASCDPAASACPADAPCDPSAKVCTEPPAPTVGSSCAGTSDCSTKTLFGSTLYCDTTTMKCAGKVDLGQPCTPSTTGQNPCFAGDCDATTHVCALQCM